MDRTENAVTCCRRLDVLLFLSALGALPAAACAGQLGPTSRGAVAISITIPPHVVVTSAAPTDSAGAETPFCISGAGLARYRVERIASDASAKPGPPRMLPVPAGALPVGCGAAGFGLAGLASAIGETGSAAPLTLLIVPD